MLFLCFIVIFLHILKIYFYLFYRFDIIKVLVSFGRTVNFINSQRNGIEAI